MNAGAPNGFSIRRVSSADVRPLRLAVLRAGMADKTVNFEGDDDSETVHLAAFNPNGIMVGTSTWLERECMYAPGTKAVQLRGMATDTTSQGRGIGSALVEAGLAQCRQQSVAIVWANARDGALPFYERHGFVVKGDGFIETITQLPHHVVVHTLAQL